MADETPRFGIPYPSRGQADYFSVYQSGMNTIDSIVFAEWAARNSVLHGGGSMTWDLVGSDYEFAHADSISFQTPAFGSAQSIAASTTVVAPAHFLIVDVARGASSGSSSLVFYAATQVPVDNASTVVAWHNPTTHELVFQTGLVIALGGTATGIQPQGGGGGGSISVTDGSTTVNPATTVTVVGGVVANLGGGNAEINIPALSVTDGTVTVNPTTAIEFYNAGGFFISDEGGGAAKVSTSLITRFVVDRRGAGASEYERIQDAIDAAAAFRAVTNSDQIVYIRPYGAAGGYKEDLVIPLGISLVGLVEQQRMAPSQRFDTPLYDEPITRVIIDNNSTAHTFADKSPARSSFQNIVFRGKSLVGIQSVFYVGDLDSEPSSIEFKNCRFEHREDSVFFVQDPAEKNYRLSVSFTDCSFYVENGSDTDVFLLGSGDQWDDDDFRSTYLFNRCYFINNSGGVNHWMRLNYKYNALTLLDCRSVGFLFDVAVNRATVEIERCFFDNGTSGLARGFIFDDNRDYPGGDLLIKQCEFITDDNVVYYASHGNSYGVNDWASTYLGPSNNNDYPVQYGNVGYNPMGYKSTPASYAGDTLAVGSGGTYNAYLSVTTVTVDTSYGGATTINLPNPNYCKNQTVVVGDSGGSAGSAGRNITVACPSASVVGPHQVLNHNGQVTTFKAVQWGSGIVWKTINALW